MGDLLLRLPLSLFAWREGVRGRDAPRWDRASAPGASAKIRSRSSTSDLMASRSILPLSGGCIGHYACASIIKNQMDEFELIRWLDVLVETGMIRLPNKFHL